MPTSCSPGLLDIAHARCLHAQGPLRVILTSLPLEFEQPSLPQKCSTFCYVPPQCHRTTLTDLASLNSIMNFLTIRFLATDPNTRKNFYWFSKKNSRAKTQLMEMEEMYLKAGGADAWKTPPFCCPLRGAQGRQTALLYWSGKLGPAHPPALSPVFCCH